MKCKCVSQVRVRELNGRRGKGERREVKGERRKAGKVAANWVSRRESGLQVVLRVTEPSETKVPGSAQYALHIMCHMSAQPATTRSVGLFARAAGNRQQATAGGRVVGDGRGGREDGRVTAAAAAAALVRIFRVSRRERQCKSQWVCH
jgi:hypothetical protein